MKQNPSDPVIDEMREVRHGISAGLDHDPTRIVAFCMTHRHRGSLDRVEW